MVNLHLSAIRDRFTDHYGDEKAAEIDLASSRRRCVQSRHVKYLRNGTYNPYRYDLMMNITKNKRR